MVKKFRNKIDEIIRVNHAGEFGAQRIYSGQIKFSKDKKLKDKLKKIVQEEYEHYDYFNNAMLEKRTRPTLMSPLWYYGGYAAGAVTSLMGERYVLACTEAVEEVIVEHYEEQIQFLKKNGLEKNLMNKIKRFKADEDAHRSYAEDSNLNKKGVKAFKDITKSITRLAIKISKKI